MTATGKKNLYWINMLTFEKLKNLEGLKKFVTTNKIIENLN